MKEKAFTLAEVLITLTIIGVIAAITIPNLYSKYQKHVWATQAKKAYSLLSTATTQVSRDIDNLHLFVDNNHSTQHNKDVYDAYEEKLNGRICLKYIPAGKYYSVYNFSVSDKNPCWQNAAVKDPACTVKTLNNNTASMCTEVIMQLQDKSRIKIYAYADGGARAWDLNGTNGYPLIRYVFQFDVNGRQWPNIYGRDIFWFVIEDGNRPVLKPYYRGDDCNSSGAGKSCAHHLMYNGWKMDY